jgi:hypothetical protein
MVSFFYTTLQKYFTFHDIFNGLKLAQFEQDLVPQNLDTLMHTQAKG